MRDCLLPSNLLDNTVLLLSAAIVAEISKPAANLKASNHSSSSGPDTALFPKPDALFGSSRLPALH